MASAAAMAMRVRVIGDCDDIGILPFLARIHSRTDAHHYSSVVPIPENCGNWIRRGELGDFANQDLVGFPTVEVGTFASSGASSQQRRKGVRAYDR
jgi:hypothetical protein